MGRADQLLDGLARHHTAAHTEATGIFYVDGHVRAYHGGREVPKAHVARIRLSMPAELDAWVCDASGDGVLVWSAQPGASLVGELRTVAEKVRALVGEEARPTICFERGGWSPKLSKELTQAGFDVLTYRKKPAPLEPKSTFAPYSYTDARGQEHRFLLADRKVAITYTDKGKKRRFICRQITRLDEATGHQTQILTTRTDENPSFVAHLMFSRWSQENFFRYVRAHYGLDALDSYATEDDDPARMVPNPARESANRALAEARRSLAVAEANEGRASLSGRGERHPRPHPRGPGATGIGQDDPRAQAHPRRPLHGHLQRRVGAGPTARSPLRPGERRGPQPAARSVPLPGRSRARRQRAPRTPRLPLGPQAHQGHRRTVRAAQHHQKHLPGHHLHPRVLGQERAVTTQQLPHHGRSSGIRETAVGRQVVVLDWPRTCRA